MQSTKSKFLSIKNCIGNLCSALYNTQAHECTQKVCVKAKSYLSQIGDTKNKANGIQYIGFAGAIEASDGGEFLIKAIDFGTFTIGFESVQNQLFHPHFSSSTSVVSEDFAQLYAFTHLNR